MGVMAQSYPMPVLAEHSFCICSSTRSWHTSGKPGAFSCSLSEQVPATVGKRSIGDRERENENENEPSKGPERVEQVRTENWEKMVQM